MMTFSFRRLLKPLAACALLMLSGGCARRDKSGTQSTLSANRVVLYCSVDDVYARPIIAHLEAKTGLRVDVLYDTEAAKTAGLANRIRAEKTFPRGDLFWSSALLQTLLLKREELLQPYISPSARAIPRAFKDHSGAWTGIGVRERIIVYHAKVKAAPPRGLLDLTSPRWKNQIGFSNPQFGTGSDWVAALGARRGTDSVTKYFVSLQQNGARVLPGNSVVAQRVARGELSAGVTDIDDYFAERAKNPELLRAPQNPRDAVWICGSVALLKGAPHAPAAKRLLDELLKPETERLLMRQMRGVESVRDARFAKTPDDSARWPAAWDKLREPLARVLLSD